VRALSAVLLFVVTLFVGACGSDPVRSTKGVGTTEGVAAVPLDTCAEAPDSLGPPCRSRPGPRVTSGVADDSDMGTDEDIARARAARGLGDLETVLSGTFDGSHVNTEVRVESRTGSPLEKAVTTVTIEGGSITEPISPFCQRISQSELTCPYEGDLVTDFSPTALIRIQPNADKVTITATSAYTPSKDSDLSNNTKTIAIKTS
jgi:hypothetical protein